MNNQFTDDFVLCKTITEKVKNKFKQCKIVLKETSMKIGKAKTKRSALEVWKRKDKVKVKVKLQDELIPPVDKFKFGTPTKSSGIWTQVNYRNQCDG